MRLSLSIALFLFILCYCLFVFLSDFLSRQLMKYAIYWYQISNPGAGKPLKDHQGRLPLDRWVEEDHDEAPRAVLGRVR